MKRVVKLRVRIDSDRLVYVVCDEGPIHRMIALIRPDDLDYIRGDTDYSKTVEGTFTFDTGKARKGKGARRAK